MTMLLHGGAQCSGVPARGPPTIGALRQPRMTRRTSAMRRQRVLSGMRPTGALHLGHYHGALKNWVRLQDDYECFYFVADWHALTTHYEEREVIEQQRLRHGDRLARRRPRPGALRRSSSRAACPSTPSCSRCWRWARRSAGSSACRPTRTRSSKLKDRDLATYGFLGYPLLQAADILIYKAAYVPVGEDQALARRAHARGRAPLQPPVRPRAATSRRSRRRRCKKLGKDDARRRSRRQRKAFQRGRRRRGARRGARADRRRSGVARPRPTASG